MANAESNWREHMMDNVLSWLTKGESVRLDDDFLMLLGNPSLFQCDTLSSLPRIIHGTC